MEQQKSQSKKGPQTKKYQTPQQTGKQNKSILEIISEYIEQYEQDSPNEFSKDDQNLRKSYTLYEDLKIVYEVATDSTHEGLGPKFWTELIDKSKINRQKESLRDRYKKYLKYLNKEDFDKIVHYLQQNGIEGYLFFEKNENGKVLKNISKYDPLKFKNEKGSEKKPIKEQNESDMKAKNWQKTVNPSKNYSNKENSQIQSNLQTESNPKRKYPFPQKDSFYQRSFKKKSHPESSQCLCSLEAIHSNLGSQQCISDTIKMKNHFEELESFHKLNKLKDSGKFLQIHTDFNQRQIQRQDMATQDNLQEILLQLEETYNIDREDLLQELQNVSGNMKDLYDILENNNQNVRWTQNDDMILQSVNNKNDKQLKLLLKYKGEERIRRRCNFLNIEACF